MARKPAFCACLNLAGENAHDIGAAGVELGDLVRRNIEAGYLESLAAEEQRQRQAHIAHSDDADAGFAGFDLLLEFGQMNPGCSSHGDDCNEHADTDLWQLVQRLRGS